MRSVIIIPARYASTRLPRKLLLNETGKPLIQHTYEAAQKAALPESVCVACDCVEIRDVVTGFGGRAVLTDPNAQSGTDRIAEVAATLDGVDFVVNVQGDEPELKGETIDRAVRLLERHPNAVMATLATPIRDKQQLEDRSCVKVVFDGSNRALYFSRSVIPCPRQWNDELLDANPSLFYQHIGLYVYRRDFLLQLSGYPQSPKEKAECLEQLRVLDNGQTIMVEVVDEPTIGIDTPEDYRRFVTRYKASV